jgi:hypothetical protein
MKSIILIILASITFNNQSFIMEYSPTITISTAKTQFEKNEAVVISFLITNTSNKNIKVCKYLTPCEGFMGKFLEIKEIKNNKDVAYKGIMVKRGAPESDDYIEIKPSEKTECSINIKEAYPIDKEGEYTIQFKGKPANNLPDSNTIKIKISKKE